MTDVAQPEDSVRFRSALLTSAIAVAGLTTLPTTASAAEPAVIRLAGGTRGDGGPATDALVDAISAAEAPDGTVWVVENGSVLRRVDGTTGVITSVPTSITGMRKVEVDGAGTPYVMTSGTIYRLAANGSTEWYGGLPGGTVADFDVATDGTIYAAGEAGVQSIAPDGTRTTVVASGPWRVAVGPDSAVYVVGNSGLERISGGVSETVVADAGWARGVDVAPDGTVYLADNSTYFRVAPDGSVDYFTETLRTCVWDWIDVTAGRLLSPCGLVEAYDTTTAAGTLVAGTDASGSPDGTPAEEAWETEVRGVALGTDGLVYYAAEDRLRRIEDDGTLATVASGLHPYRLAAAPDGSIYVVNRTPWYPESIVRVAGGVKTTVTSGGRYHGVAVDSDGVVWFVDSDRQVRRIVDGTPVAVGSPLPAQFYCCDLTYDPYASRMLVVTGASVDAITSDGTRTPVAALSGETAAAGPDGTVYGPHGWARRGEVLSKYLGEGSPAPAQIAVTADGQVLLADSARHEVRAVAPLPAPDVPTVGTLVATAGPGRITFQLERPQPGPWSVMVYARTDGRAPQVQYDGEPVATASSLTEGDVTIVWGRETRANSSLAPIPRYVTVFVYKPFTNDYVLRTVTVTPLPDDEGPAPVTNLAIDPVNDAVTFTNSASPDALPTARVRWAYGTTPPATPLDGDGGSEQLPQNARYQDDVAYSVWAEDYAGNLSDPVTIVMPKLTSTSGGPSPAFLSYESDEASGRMRLDHAAGTVTMAAGDVAPATFADGTWPTCCNGDTVTNAEGLTYGGHYSFALFTRTADGLHYTRVPYTAVFGGNTTKDVITIGGTGVVNTGGLATLSGTVKQGGTNQPRPGTRVELWARTLPSTTYQRIAVGTTTATATYSFGVRPRTNTYYQVRAGANDPMAPPRAASAARLVRVTPKVAIRLSTTRVSAGRAVRVYGSIAPSGRRSLRLQRLTSGGWVTITTRTTDAYGRTYYDLTRTRGTHKVRWYAPTSTTLNQAVSATATFTVV